MVWAGGYLPADEVALIDGYMRRMQAKEPHLRASRTQAIRKLCLLGLRAEGELPAELQSLLPAEKSGAS